MVARVPQVLHVKDVHIVKRSTMEANDEQQQQVCCVHTLFSTRVMKGGVVTHGAPHDDRLSLADSL